MYGGLDKGGGGVVGSGADPFLSERVQSVEDIVGSAAGDETLCCEESVSECVSEGVSEEGGGEMRKVFLSARVSAETGELEWVKSYDAEAVMRRTIGMNLMTSMLHDNDRNAVYEKAISIIIKDFQDVHGRAPTVLDIGTGTGLLAMLAVKHGASYVVACEMFEAMAEVATEVVTVNGLSDQVAVVAAKSSDIDSLPFQPDILVSELLDSALLGEGILLSHGDALTRLMDASPSTDESSPQTEAPDVFRKRVVPYGGRVYGTAVSGDQIKHMCRVEDIGNQLCGASPWRRAAFDTNPQCDGDSSNSNPASSCGGGSKMIPVHWNEQACPSPSCANAHCHLSHKMSDSVELMSFEFFHKEFSNESFSQTIVATKEGIISGILIWWVVDMLAPELDPERSVFYSTEPGVQNWQDHWQQVVFPLPKDYHCDIGDEFLITSAHDGVHMWLEMSPVKKRKLTTYVPCSPSLQAPDAFFTPEVCQCGWHILHNSERMQMLNDSKRMHTWERGIDALIREYATANDTALRSIVDLSDGSILSLMAAATIRKLSKGDDDNNTLQILSLERKDFSHLFSTQLCTGNAFNDIMEVVDNDSWGELKKAFLTKSEGTSSEDDSNVLKISAVISECFYFQLHAQPIHSALSFYYSLRELSRSERVTSNIKVCPSAARVMVAAFELTNLQVNHGWSGSPCGFVHDALDNAQTGWQENWFPYKLGMYSKKLLTAPVCVVDLDYQALFDPNMDPETQSSLLYTNCMPMPLIKSGVCHCVAMWVDYAVTPELDITYWADDANDGTFNFPPYLKTNLKFFAAASKEPDDLKDFAPSGFGVDVTAGNVINCAAEWHKDSALIKLDYKF